MPAALDAVNNIGGWERFQSALAVIKSIADKKNVKVETVALRWQMMSGTYPLATTR